MTEPKNETAAFARLRDTREALRQSSAYSRRIGLLRWALPLSVLLVLGALVVWPMVREGKLTDAALRDVPNLIIENLHFTGLDALGQAYSVTAKRALQAGGGKGLVDLEQPEAEITLQSGAWLTGNALMGRYDEKAKLLWLGGDVHLFHDAGYQVLTGEAQINLGGHEAWGHQPIMIQGPFGVVRGAGFRFLDHGNVLVIEGEAVANLSLGALASKDEPLQKDKASGKKAVGKKGK